MTTATEEHRPENAAFAGLDEQYARLPLEQLVPSPTNLRTHFDGLENLFASVAAKGVLQAILVRPFKGSKSKAGLKGDGPFFEIVAGECRYRAAKAALLSHIRAVITEYTDEEVLEIQLEENLHRKDLTDLEEAATFKRLMASNPDKHSAAAIGTRIGKSASYVWDTVKLLDLVDEAKTLLETRKISRGHAILISRQKPEHQKRIIDTSEELLWRYLQHGLEFDGVSDPKEKPGKYDDVAPVTVRELEAAIAHHIRFDLAHAAKAVPLQYEETAAKVEEAAAQPGRGKKVIAITFEDRPSDDAKDPNERTYGIRSWKRADGTKGTSGDRWSGKKKDSPTCEYSALGVVVAGDEHYGETFQVCVNRDKCKVHWKESVEAKEKSAKLRASGQNKKAAKVEKKAEKKQESAWEREQRERRAKDLAWDAIAAHVIADAAAQVKGVKVLTPAQGKALIALSDTFAFEEATLKKHLGATWFKTPAAAILVNAVTWFEFDTYVKSDKSGFDQYVRKIAKPFGLDIKRLEAIRDKHQPKAEPAKPDAKAGKTKAA